VADALKAVTLDAAFLLHQDSEKGSIEVGKRADLTILAEDPLQAGPDRLRDIKVVATIKDGTVHRT
jgi:hypothetical protein